MSPVRIPLRRVVSIVAAVLIAAASFVYRFNTLDGRFAGFENDHFPQLVRAMAMLDGERPLRDFMDAELRALWPAPTYSTSALAQKLLGRSLRSEALLTICMLSIGAAVLFLLAVEFSGAIVPALVATPLAVALRPALYNYPKIVLYVLAIGAMLGYARRPGNGRLVVIGVTIGVATLFRHDHGVYLGIAAIALLTLMHGTRMVRPLGIVVATSAALLVPGAVLAQMDGGVATYLRRCIELSRAEAARTTNASVRFTIDRSQPLFRQVDRTVMTPRVAVRWAATITPETRRRAENELRLAQPIVRGDPSNWSYTIDDPSAAHLSSIVHDPRVVDTDGIDRARFVLTAPPPPPERWTGWLGRWRVAPGVVSSENAQPWLYVTAWVVVLCGAACAAWPRSARAFTPADVPLPAIRAMCVLAIVMLALLLRTANLSRFADVSVAVTIVGAWLLAGMWRAVGGWARGVRAAVRTAMIVLLVLDAGAVGALADVPHQVQVAALGNPSAARRQWTDVWRKLGALPSSLDGIDEDLQRASAYLRRCTRPGERLFMGDNLPELFYFADRPFAAGQVRYFSNFYSSQPEQREAIDRWTHQTVPLAVTPAGRRFDDEFADDYPLLASYVRAHYRRAGSLTVEPGAVVDVWVDQSRMFATDRQSGLPCEAQPD